MKIPAFCELCMAEGGHLIPLSLETGAWTVAQDCDDPGTALICEPCIRQIKRLSFADIADAPEAPAELTMPDGPDEEIL